ncbi:MAG: DUF6913 domain-containing protein [Bacteroidales bacterium]
MIDMVFRWLQNRAITSRQKPRNKQFVSFDAAKTVVLILDMQEKEVLQNLPFIKTFFQKKNIQCSFILYKEKEILPEPKLPVNNVKIFSQKQLNWFGCPIDRDNKLSQPYDIAIDLCRQEHKFPLHYIVSVLQARMIIGGIFYPNNPYDMIIDLPKEASLQEYLQQINYYLSTINNPKN